MKIEPEKPKKPRHSARTLSEAANLKRFLEDQSDVLLYLEAILLDAHQHLNHYRHADYSRDVATLRRRYESEGLSFATKTLPELWNCLTRSQESGKPSYPSFKLVRGGKHPVFLRQLFAMVCECHDDCACIEAARYLYQLCYAFKKFRGPYRTSTLQKQLWSFVETDIELRYIDFFSEPCYPILLKARQMVKEIFQGISPEFDPDLFVPRPGPGATNTPRRKNVRYRPHVLYKQLCDVFPPEDWNYSHPWDVVTGSAAFKELKAGMLDQPSSRFKFVPKTYGKPRGICIEELETQFLQQALKGAMYHVMESHPLTKGRVNFTRQDTNRELALSSSATGMFATLDMSAASDRVSRHLVRHLFHDCPDMLEALLATSTRNITLPEGMIEFPSDLPAEKFAPMGSATCFPIMALVHFVLIRAILDLSTVPRSSARDVYVYGDDILVRTECVDAVYDYLPLFGMKFNTDKSFSRWHFRESCGMDALKGVAITPVYFKYIPKLNSPRDVVLSLLSSEATLFKNGFFETAKLLRSKLSKVRCLRGYTPLPYTSPKSPVLGFVRESCDAPSCRHIGLKRRYDLELQRFEVKVVCAVPSQEQLTIDRPEEAYLRSFCDKGINTPDVRSNHFGQSKLGCYPTIDHPRCVRRALARDFALADAAGTLLSAEEVKDTSEEPPRFLTMWCPESAL
jgi:hypothetical protein